MSISLQPPSQASQDWLDKLAAQADYLDATLLSRSCQLVEAITATTENDIPYAPSAIDQGLHMADELIALQCDNNTLSAALIYPCFCYQQLTPELIEQQLNASISKLVSGVQRMEVIHHIDRQSDKLKHQHIDNLRKMSLAMADDVRIVLIKLAERLTVLKYLRRHPSQQRQIEAKQIMNIYAPLANRLGIGQFKWQLEDLSFRFLHNNDYQDISKALKMHRSDREAYIKNLITKLSIMLKKAHIKPIDISGRAKHIYSIYRKIQRKKVSFSEIYDTSALRVLVPSVKDCYTTLSLVHNEWDHVPSEFDDYIAKPKPNGYRSIHTVIIGSDDSHAEIQIRTFQMHDESELGVAAHWKYKEGGGEQSSYEQKINWLRSVIDWQKQITDPNDEHLFQKTFEDRIYAFTPTGDIVDLDSGATPLDFAYHVHTEVGHCCRGAKVNDVLVPLTHVLSTGDRVSILTNKQGEPSRDWLNMEQGYLKTPRAIAKVRNWFKKQSQDLHLEKGQQLWEKACRRHGIAKSSLEAVAAEFNVANGQDLLIAIGSGDIGITTVANRIKHPENKSETDEKDVLTETSKKIKMKTSQLKQSNFIIEGVGDLLTQLGRCCKPIPGDDIIGYVTKGRGVTIHQQSCRNVRYALQRDPQRILNVSWGHEERTAYPVELVIEAENRSGLIRDISSIIVNEKIALLGLNSRVNPLENTVLINLTIEIKDLSSLRKTLSQLKQIEGINRITRI